MSMRPAEIDKWTGYRMYSTEQINYGYNFNMFKYMHPLTYHQLDEDWRSLYDCNPIILVDNNLKNDLSDIK